jgi:hypothetical protein
LRKSIEDKKNTCQGQGKSWRGTKTKLWCQG